MITWTEEQDYIIRYDRPANLLVSAAAGSGKTAVLTERIVQRALAKKIRLPHLLVMTFTELAAKQMKQRIAARFREVRKEDADKLLQELPLAQISTVHAFCNQVLSAHLDRFAGKDGNPLLEPGYRVADEALSKTLLDQSLDNVISTLNTGLDTVLRKTDPHLLSKNVPRGLQEGESPSPFILTGEDRTFEAWYKDYRSLSLAFAPSLTDAPFRSAITSMLHHLHHLPHYENRATEAVDQLFVVAEAFPSDDITAFWWDRFENAYDNAKSALDDLRQTSVYASFVNPKSNPILQLKMTTHAMENVIDQLSGPHERTADRWDTIARVGESLDELTFPSYMGKSTNESIQERNRYLVRFWQDVLPLAGLISDRTQRTERLKPYFEGFPPVFTMSTEELCRDLLDSSRVTARFIEVVLLVDADYRKRRFSDNVILFSDIEHGALALLEQEDIGARYRNHFDEIYVDEYQDTSSIQDAILKVVGRDNVFMVGDVKQSIYRFRYANPKLFTALADVSELISPDQETSATTSRTDAGYLALLSRNFRSRPGILEFINDFFSAFLTRESGDIEYDETQAMTPVRPVSESDKPPVVLSVACMTDENTEDVEKDDNDASTAASGLSQTEREAVIAADIIQDLLANGAAPESIAVLLPTNDNCRVYGDILKAYHIPIVTRTGPVFPDNPVTRQVEALLALLDNPLQDIPLINTLMGPFVPEPFTETELVALAGTATLGQDESLPINNEREAEIRAAAEQEKERSFHRRFHAVAKGDESICKTLGETLSNKVARFSKTLERWRFLAQELPARELIDIIFSETDYEAIVATFPRSEHYAADLDMLKELLEGEPGAPLTDLREALKIIREAREQTRSIPSSESALLPGAVHVLTRHSSKGLQWDHVILGGLFRANERQDANAIITFSEQQGLSSCTITDGGLAIYNNPLHERAVSLHKRDAQAESWRLLYVSMTRAKERLFLLFPAKKTIGDIGRVANIIDRVNDAAQTMTKEERKQRAAFSTEFAAVTGSDAELILSVLALHDPFILGAMIHSEGAKEDETPCRSTAEEFSFEHATAYVERWIDVYKRVEDRASSPTIIGADGNVPSDMMYDATDKATIDSEKAFCDLLMAKIPREDAAHTPAKISVTEIKRLREAEEATRIASEGEYADAPIPIYTGVFERERERIPVPVDTGTFERHHEGAVESVHRKSLEHEHDRYSAHDMALTMRRREKDDLVKGVALGTILHTVFQFLDIEPLRNASEEEGVALYIKQLNDLRNRDVLDSAEYDAAAPFSKEAIQWSKSDLAGRILAVSKTSGKVYREMPFTLAVPSKTLMSSWPGDEMTLVQGMIDLWFVEENGDAILIDFKSDRLPGGDEKSIFKERYNFQLQTYAKAIERATGRTVRERILWLIRAGRGLVL